MNIQSENSNQFRWAYILGPLLFLFAIGAVTWRAEVNHSLPGEIVDSRYDSAQGYRDFHNAIYLPGRAFVSGVNPYSKEFLDYHPDGLGFPLFAPSSLLVHAPLAFLNLRVAELVYLGINICLLIYICWFCVRQSTYPYSVGIVLGLAGLMIITRPGILNFLGMQMSLLLIVGTLLSLEYSESNPVLSGFGLLLACCKPTYAIPLTVMLIARRNISAAAAGILLCAVANCTAVGLIASQNGGVEQFVDKVTANYAAVSTDPLEVPEVQTSWARLDVYSVVARWYDVSSVEKLNFIIPGCVLLFGALVVLIERRHDHRVGINSRTGLMSILVMLACLYHQPYDALVLWIPLAALFLGSTKFDYDFGSVTKFLLMFLLLIPMFNFLSTRFVLGKLKIERPDYLAMPDAPNAEQVLAQLANGWPWKLTVTVNGIAIALAIVVVTCSILSGRFSQSADTSA